MSIRVNSTDNNQTNKRNNPVTKGAKIGAGMVLGLAGAKFLNYSHELKKVTGDGFFKTLNREANIAAEYCGGDKKTKAAMIISVIGLAALKLLATTGLAAAAGGGLGLLVKGHNDKKEAEKQEIVEQVKAELLEEQE